MEGTGVEKILARYEDRAIARAFFRATIQEHPGRLVMLCDRAGVLARSDRADTAAR